MELDTVYHLLIYNIYMIFYCTLCTPISIFITVCAIAYTSFNQVLGPKYKYRNIGNF